jgi:hypothetical protein
MLKSILDHDYMSDTCFLCAEKFDQNNGSKEHVFPKWLQHEFNLWNRKITLVNQTKISYKDLVIPCCVNCNNTTLSQLELRMKNAFKKGYEGILKVSELDLFLWCAKLLLGMIYKEKFLRMDLTDVSAGTITDEGLLKNYAMLHFWIKNFRSSEMDSFTPGSIFIFQTQDVNSDQEKFAILDDIETSFFMIRVGNVLIFADFLDNGLHRLELEKYYYPIQTISLHPIQVKELVAIAVYNSKRLRIKTTTSFQASNGGLSTSVTWEPVAESYFEEWDNEQFLLIHEDISGIPADILRSGPNSYRTVLFDETGNPLYWPNGENHPLQPN